MHILAPAKINLFLRIVGRRADGYHLIDSFMVPVSLYDEIEITADRVRGDRPCIRLSCNVPTLPTDESNLAYRAALAFCEEAKVAANIQITLDKRIPSQAGLGGGSSDAAGVLRALNKILAVGFTPDKLSEIALCLGADVPFFIHGKPARVGGIGDVIAEIRDFPTRWVLIIVPDFSVPTPWAYAQFDKIGAAMRNASDSARAPLAPGTWPESSLFVNDLESAVCPEYPTVAEIKEGLRLLGAEMALMSGSGSSVFGVFDSERGARSAANAWTSSGNVAREIFVVRTSTDVPPAGNG